LAGCTLSWNGIEDPIQEFKFPQEKFSGSKRDNEIFAGELGFFFGAGSPKAK